MVRIHNPCTLIQTHSSLLGERTPVGVRMNGPPAYIPEHWKMCRSARRFRGAASGLLHDPQIPQEHGNDETPANQKVLEMRDGTLGEGQWYVFSLMWPNPYIIVHFHA